MKVSKVMTYLQIYKNYLIENNLEDDSDSIKVKSLINFVETEIDKEDHIRLLYSITK